MASAEVLQSSAVASSRKQGHLEAGKRRLEEFRKKKAEGKAKKAASTSQLLSPDVNYNEKFSQDRDHVGEKATSQGDNATTIDLSRSITVYENSAVASSQSTEADLSRVTEAISVDSDSKSHTVRLSTELAKDEGSKLYKNSRFSWSMDGYFSEREKDNDLSSNRESGEEILDESAKGQQNALCPVYPKSTFDVKSKDSPLYPSINVQSEDLKSSGDQYIEDQNKSDSFWSDPSYLSGMARSGFKQSAGMFPSTSGENTYTVYTDTTRVEQRRPDFMDQDGSMALDIGAKKVYGSIDDHFDIDSDPQPSSQTSSINFYSTLKTSSSQHSFSSTITRPGTWRTRPSFLDFVDVPRPSSTSHLALSESAKADPPVLLNSSKIDTAEDYMPSSSQKPEVDNFQQSPGLVNPGSFGNEGSNMNFSAFLSNGQQMREEVRDGDGKGMQDIPGPTKDEDFAALEQHIEDLTREKFSLQRALESSRTLAESLATENSSLTESFNQQGKVVNQLKSDMEQLQEEIRAQLLALDTVKMEYANAQLECSAADERAKILASEVIGLEEKALRLRSNELKLEKQLEKSNAEINSYKKKVSSLERERQDFQSTIEALQEEKKLLQSKLRKASSNGRVIDIGKASAIKKDAFTSTEDLGIDLLNLVGGENAVEMMSSSTVNTEQEVLSPVLPFGNVSVSNSQSETGSFLIPDASGAIPNDQLRMIDNIYSLISELALEKEELMQALRVQSTNNSKLMDMNKELSQKLETQTQRLELLTAQHMAGENAVARPVHTQSTQEPTAYTDEGDEVVERVLSWIMKLFPGGPTKRRSSKLL